RLMVLRVRLMRGAPRQVCPHRSGAPALAPKPTVAVERAVWPRGPVRVLGRPRPVTEPPGPDPGGQPITPPKRPPWAIPRKNPRADAPMPTISGNLSRVVTEMYWPYAPVRIPMRPAHELSRCRLWNIAE